MIRLDDNLKDRTKLKVLLTLIGTIVLFLLCIGTLFLFTKIFSIPSEYHNFLNRQIIAVTQVIIFTLYPHIWYKSELTIKEKIKSYLLVVVLFTLFSLGTNGTPLTYPLAIIMSFYYLKRISKKSPLRE